MDKKMRAIIAFSFLILFSVSNLDAQSLIIVSPTGNKPPYDVQAVQAAVNAVDPGGTVLLKATNLNGTPTPFNFGEPVTWASAGNVLNNTRRVLITKDVKIFGEKDHKGNPLTKIKGGVLSFFSPLPTSPYPAPDITIEGIHFDGAFYAPILIRYASGLKIVGNRIENVHPFAVSVPFTDPIDGLVHTLRIQQGISIGSPFAGYVTGALTGMIEVSDNVIDLTIDPTLPTGVYPATFPKHSPRNTFGEGIFAGFATGASIVISGNYITNCSRNQIEVFDNYLGTDGQGSVLIEGNTVITPEDGIAFPSKFCPNGIIAGWVLNPSASNDPTKNTKYTISHNYVENKSTRQGIGIFTLSDGAVIEKNEVVVTGNSTNPGSSGLPLNRGLSIVSDNCYVGQNKIAGEGEYAMAFIPINQYQTASSNVCVGNNINNFNPNNSGAHLYFGPGFVLPTGIIVPSASNNTVVGGHGTVIDLGDNNTFKGGYRDLTGSHITTPGGVGDEISDIKDWWDLP